LIIGGILVVVIFLIATAACIVGDWNDQMREKMDGVRRQ
jgi:hypothetical protein